MHGEHLVVHTGAQHLAIWCSKLKANEYSFKPTQDEKEHRHDAVHNAELFVVNSEEPRLPPRGRNRTLEATLCT